MLPPSIGCPVTTRKEPCPRRSPGWRFQLRTLTLAAAIMAGYDTNPFADPVDVNPFQVMARGFMRLDGPWWRHASCEL